MSITSPPPSPTLVSTFEGTHALQRGILTLNADTTPEWSSVMAERLNPSGGPELLKSRYLCVK